MTIARGLAPIALAAIAAAGAPASADELRATRDQQLDEISHTVLVRISDGVATYTVQRQFQNRGKVADEARLAIDLPAGAAATGLRIRAGGTWHTGELLDSKVAAARYQELTGAGVHDPKDPALLSWVSSTELSLQVFPVLPGAVNTVEYTLTVPTRYAAGRYWLTYPRVDPAAARARPAARKLVDPVVTVAPGWTLRRGGVTVDGKPVEPGKPVALAPLVREPWRGPAPTPASAADDAGDAPGDGSDDDARGLAVLGVEAPPVTTWSGRLGRVVASDAHALSRLELDVAPRLSDVPRRAQVVFVLDASYSAGPDGLAAQLAIVRAYLTHVPDAQLEPVPVRRTARRVFGRFAAPAEASRLLDAAGRAGALALGNGSALDAGAKLAASLLAGRAGPQRVILATDELLRSSLTEAQALASLAALAPAAVVHVVVPSLGTGARSTGARSTGSSGGAAALPSLERDDDAGLAALATGHHGIFARVSGFPAKEADLAPVVLELVRPTRIEHVATAGTSPLTIPDVLREGDGLRLWGSSVAVTAAPATLALTGKLWSDPIRLDLAATAAFSTATAAFVFGADQHDGLSEAEQRTVALAGRAVSPVTSYLAIEPGVRPSKIGLDELEGSGWGTLGTGSYGSRCRGFRIAQKLDLASLIPTEACARKHAPDRAWSVKLSVETTKDEIVDVTVDGALDPLAACIVEAAWSVRLPSTFDHGQTYRLELSDR